MHQFCQTAAATRLLSVPTAAADLHRLSCSRRAQPSEPKHPERTSLETTIPDRSAAAALAAAREDRVCGEGGILLRCVVTGGWVSALFRCTPPSFAQTFDRSPFSLGGSLGVQQHKYCCIVRVSSASEKGYRHLGCAEWSLSLGVAWFVPATSGCECAAVNLLTRRRV